MNQFLKSEFFHDFLKAPIAVISFTVVLILILLALFANLIAPTNPFDPATLNLMNGFTAPMAPNAFT